MKQERRYVPADWVHPQEKDGGYIPLFYDLDAAMAEWEFGCECIARGDMFAYYDVFTKTTKWTTKADAPINTHLVTFAQWEWDEAKPGEEKDYMPRWKPEERTHVQLYETVSEGTPISPLFASDQELDKWIEENGQRVCINR